MLTARVNLQTPRRDGGVSTKPALEHARIILRDHVGLPLTENHVLVADCIQSIARAKQLDFAGASDYLIGAIRHARVQGIPINRFYFVDGKYMEDRPHAFNKAEQRKLDNLEVNARFQKRLKERFGTVSN